MKSVNGRIKEVIESKNLTANSAAKRTGYSATHFYKIFKDENTSPGGDFIQKFCETFKVDINWLYKGEGKMFISSESKKVDNYGEIPLLHQLIASKDEQIKSLMVFRDLVVSKMGNVNFLNPAIEETLTKSLNSYFQYENAA